MKEKLMFIVTVEKNEKNWLVSDKFDNYNKAQAWRYEQERQLLAADPSRKCVRSNLLFVREVEGAQ